MQTLPAEILHTILSFVDKPKDIYNFSRVNITNANIINNRLFWKRKLIEWHCYVGQQLFRNGIVTRTSDIFFLDRWNRLSIRNILLFPPIQLQTIHSMEQYKILMQMMKLITKEGDKWIKRYKPCFFLEKGIDRKIIQDILDNEPCLIRLTSPSTYSITYKSNHTINKNICYSSQFLFKLLYNDIECCKFVWWRCSYDILKDTAFQIAINNMRLELSKLGTLPLINDFYFG